MTQHVVSTKTLIKSSIAAGVLAALVFICIILPAEYNIDPTTIGKKLGLTILSNTVESNSALVVSSASDIIDEPSAREQQVIEVTVPAGTGIEYKFYMSQYEKMTYEWGH